MRLLDIIINIIILFYEKIFEKIISIISEIIFFARMER